MVNKHDEERIKKLKKQIENKRPRLKDKYDKQLAEIENVSFDTIRAAACKVLNEVFNDEQLNYLHDCLYRGKKVIGKDEHELILKYLNDFGKKHLRKMQYALEEFKENVPLSNIVDNSCSVIDWGCGQGLATICFLDYLKANNIQTPIEKILLVDASALATDYAYKYLKLYKNKGRCLEIKECLFNESKTPIDDIAQEDHGFLNEQISTPSTIHLLSNIIDVEGINLDSFVSSLTRVQGDNYYICVSPLYESVEDSELKTIKDFKQENTDQRIAYLELFAKMQITSKKQYKHIFNNAGCLLSKNSKENAICKQCKGIPKYCKFKDKKGKKEYKGENGYEYSSKINLRIFKISNPMN